MEDWKIWIWKFYWKNFQVNKNNMSHEEIIKHKNLLYSADLDYLTARKLYLSWKLFYFPFLTHASQTFEKYLKFISYFIYDNEIEKFHNSKYKFANTDFFKCLDEEWQKVIKQLLNEFIRYRYLDKSFNIDIIKVINTLDKFVLEYYKTLSNIWILWFANFNDNLAVMLNYYDWIPTNIISNIYINRKEKLEWELKMLLNIDLVRLSNNFFNETCEIFDNHINKQNNINFTWIRINTPCQKN